MRGRDDTFYNQGSIDNAISLQLTHIFHNDLIQVRFHMGVVFLLDTEHDIKLLRCIRMIEMHGRYRPLTYYISHCKF